VEAIEDLENAQDMEPDNPQILYRLGMGYYAFERYKRAVKVFKHALQLNPHQTYLPDIYYHVGLAYTNLEKLEKAIYLYSKVSPSIFLQGD